MKVFKKKQKKPSIRKLIKEIDKNERKMMSMTDKVEDELYKLINNPDIPDNVKIATLKNVIASNKRYILTCKSQELVIKLGQVNRTAEELMKLLQGNK